MKLYVTVCMYCKEMAVIRATEQEKGQFAEFPSDWHPVSHGICPDCKVGTLNRN